MKAKSALMTTVVLVTCVVVPAWTGTRAVAEDTSSHQRDHEIGVQVYVYAYPMILMEVTRRVSTNVEAPAGFFAPMNQFVHVRAFPDHTFKEVVRPNADTLYSIVWFDVSDEPLVLSVPATDRYYMMPMSAVGVDGKPYHGSNRYLLHFDQDQLPPVNGFWSLAMYDSEGYFVENPINRYSIGDRDKLSFNGDGSLDITIQHETPGDEKESNWLPAPGDDFNLVIRLYWPRAEILSGAWNPPALKRID